MKACDRSNTRARTDAYVLAQNYLYNFGDPTLGRVSRPRARGRAQRIRVLDDPSSCTLYVVRGPCKFTGPRGDEPSYPNLRSDSQSYSDPSVGY